MAKDPAFLFYPGDYLRDTQCLSEKSQVAYDRIMCEHMRNICISQQQLNFFTKRLSDDEKNELQSLLKPITGGFQIEWVAESICKRRDYSKSRAENRKGKPKNISLTYDSHMENEIENEIEDIVVSKNRFSPPTKEEVVNLMAEKLDDFSAMAQAELFLNYYESNGWKVGKNKMKNWKAAASGWISRIDNFKPKNNGITKEGTSDKRLTALKNF